MQPMAHQRADKSEEAFTFLNGLTSEIFALADKQSGSRDICKLHNMITIDDAELINEAAMHPDAFIKDYNLLKLLGRNRFNTNGSEWEIRRGLTQKFFSQAGRGSNRARVHRTYARRLEEIVDPARPWSLFDALQTGAIEIFFKSLNIEMDVAGSRQLMERFRRLSRFLQFFSWRSDRLVNPAALEAAAKQLDDNVRKIAEAAPGVTLLLSAFEEQVGDRIENFVGRHEFFMAFLAGIETTVSSLSWVAHELARRPALQDELAEGIEGEKGDARALAFAHETMRMRPPLPFVTRATSRQIVLGETTIDQGHTVVFSIAGLHRKERYWTDPLRFWPDRPEFSEKSLNHKAFIPFFAGPRKCGGARLAMLEVEEATKVMLEQFHLVTPDQDPPFDYALTLRPTGWDDITITRR